MSRHDLLIFGGAARTGLAVAGQARQRGLSVACFVRPERDTAALEALGVTLIRGNAFVAADCQRAFAETSPRAVVSLLGGKDSNGRRVDAEGNIRVIDAAQAWQADLRFVLVTSIGCSEQYAALPPQVRAALGEALEAKSLAEQHLRASTLNWTLLRPTGLSDDTAQGRYRLSAQPEMIFKTYLARGDAALAILDTLTAEETRQRTLSIQPA